MLRGEPRWRDVSLEWWLPQVCLCRCFQRRLHVWLVNYVGKLFAQCGWHHPVGCGFNEQKAEKGWIHVLSSGDGKLFLPLNIRILASGLWDSYQPLRLLTLLPQTEDCTFGFLHSKTSGLGLQPCSQLVESVLRFTPFHMSLFLSLSLPSSFSTPIFLLLKEITFPKKLC